jgi:hypothetical protein
MLPPTQSQQQDPNTATYLLHKKVEQHIQKAQRSGKVVLDLCGLGLRTVPESIVQLTNLQELALSNNKFTSLPSSITQLTNLKKLYLSDNQLTNLPDSIAQLTNLQELAICNNQLTSLPDAIAHLTNLQLLALTKNQLTRLPDAIAQLTNLKELYLSNNQLISLPNAMQQLTQMKRLHLHRNNALNIPSEVLGPEWQDGLNTPQDILEYYFYFCIHHDEIHPINEAELESNRTATQTSPLATSQQNIEMHFHGTVYGVAGTAQNQIINAPNQDFDTLLNAYKQFLNDLQQKYPAQIPEAALQPIINAEFQEIQKTQPQHWQNFLNLKRLWNGGKKATFRIGEHFTEENLWGKAAIAFLEGVTEED